MKRFALAGFMLLFAQTSLADKMLSGDEIKALISNKTVSVSAPSADWQQYFAADGSSVRDNGQNSSWYIEDNKHCNTASAKFLCAPIRDNGDGTYARIKDNGDVIVSWSKIVDGKKF